MCTKSGTNYINAGVFFYMATDAIFDRFSFRIFPNCHWCALHLYLCRYHHFFFSSMDRMRIQEVRKYDSYFLMDYRPIGKTISTLIKNVIIPLRIQSNCSSVSLDEYGFQFVFVFGTFKCIRPLDNHNFRLVASTFFSFSFLLLAHSKTHSLA